MLPSSPLEPLLKQAFTAAQALETLHAHRRTHGRLEPQALQFLADGSVRLRPPADGTHLTLAQLRYTSPEQAGRLMLPDARSDLYSLGLIFYEWLLERPAFTSSDPLMLAYQQIAVLPAAPHAVDPQLPQPLSDLVMRLLAKPPEARYASAQGLADDLQHCLRQLASHGQLEPFALGRTDLQALFLLPDRLYGRADAMATLIRLWRQIARGGLQLALVGAAAGMGKTALVRALRDTVQGSGGMLVEGRFSPARRGEPYAALIDAMRTLLRQVLAGAQADRLRWRARLETSLGARVQLLVEQLPELEWISGPQTAPSAEPMPPQQRHAALLDLLALFAGPEQPLLLFLDDVHAADMASMAFLHALLRDRRASHVLLVCCYREEGDALASPPSPPLSSPIARLQTALRKDRLAATEIRLEPLCADELAALVDDSCFHIRNLPALAAEAMQQTWGNPLQLRQFLSQQVQQGHLRYERKSRAWRWTAGDIPVDHSAALASLWWREEG